MLAFFHHKCRMRRWTLESYQFGQAGLVRTKDAAGMYLSRGSRIPCRPQQYTVKETPRRVVSEPRQLEGTVPLDMRVDPPRARALSRLEDVGTRRRLFVNSELESPRRQPYEHYLFSSNPDFTTNNTEYGKRDSRKLHRTSAGARKPEFPEQYYSHILSW